jgi:hypothetical protein
MCSEDGLDPIRIHIHDNICRYVLGEKNDQNILYCFGLNPSSATSFEDDPTIINVRKIAKYNDFNSWIMLNLYPQKSNEPTEVANTYNKIIHEKNLNEILKTIQSNSTIWVAWGINIDKLPFYKCFLEIFNEIKEKTGIKYKQLGNLTKDGHPQHPLYKSTEQYFMEFDLEKYINKIKKKVIT